MASLPLDEVKQVARHFGVTLNDVVMALCAGALREYLLRRKALPKSALIAAMPVSLRAAGDSEVNNQVSMVQCVLPTQLADPLERLHAITAATGRIKHQVATFRGLIPTDFPGLAAPIWASGLSRLWARGRVAERLPPLANLAISNVPGPPIPLYLAGARVNHYFPASIVTHGLGLNITVNSYAGQLEFGVIAMPRHVDAETRYSCGRVGSGTEGARETSEVMKKTSKRQQLLDLDAQMRAPSALLLALEGRAFIEWAACVAAWPLLACAARGDGHPVLGNCQA